jgi:hypothetical protein
MRHITPEPDNYVQSVENLRVDVKMIVYILMTALVLYVKIVIMIQMNIKTIYDNFLQLIEKAQWLGKMLGNNYMVLHKFCMVVKSRTI